MKALHHCGKNSGQNNKSYLWFTPGKSPHKNRTKRDLKEEESDH